MLTDNEKIIYYVQAYLFIVNEATVSQITGFLLQGPFKFKGGGPTKSKVKGLMSASSLFDSYKNRSGFFVYKIKTD